MKIQLILLTLISILLASCGTVSSLDAPESGSKKYSRVIVRDFGANEFGYKVKSKVEMAKKSFPDLIASELQQSGDFSAVSRGGKADANTLVIDGTITRYDDGNVALRMMVGMGAGSSRFDSAVKFRDSSNRKLGEIEVDKNSWFLGGSLAASQDASSFMPGAAKKVAREASKFSR